MSETPESTGIAAQMSLQTPVRYRIRAIMLHDFTNGANRGHPDQNCRRKRTNFTRQPVRGTIASASRRPSARLCCVKEITCGFWRCRGITMQLVRETESKRRDCGQLKSTNTSTGATFNRFWWGVVAKGCVSLQRTLNRPVVPAQAVMTNFKSKPKLPIRADA